MDTIAFRRLAWADIPRTEGLVWEEDPHYTLIARQKIERIATLAGALRGPVNGYKRQRGDGVWVPCNPFSQGAIPVWIWWANA